VTVYTVSEIYVALRKKGAALGWKWGTLSVAYVQCMSSSSSSLCTCPPGRLPLPSVICLTDYQGLTVYKRGTSEWVLLVESSATKEASTGLIVQGWFSPLREADAGLERQGVLLKSGSKNTVFSC
jgi:hypothetical protein